MRLVLLFLLVTVNCFGQNKGGCTREQAMDHVGTLKEISADIAKYKNTKEEIVFDIDEENYRGKDYFVISEMQTNPFHYSTWSIFYVDKKNCTVYNYDKEEGKLLTIEVWRYKNSLDDKSIDRKIVFTDLFNEDTIIRFGPKDLDKKTPEIQEFKKKLKALELKYLVVEDFKVDNLSYLINNETFSNLNYYTNSEWLQYFISKYKVDVLKLNELMYEAIDKEDLETVKIFLKNGYIISELELSECEIIENKLRNELKESKKKNYDGYYLFEESKIKEITPFLKQKYASNKISDPDGYTNLRKGMGTKTAIIKQVKSGEHIKVLDNTNNWLLVETMDGQRGYVYRDRVKSN